MLYKKKLGQHFLTDQNIINKLVKYIDPRQDDCIVEIGPGDGAMTKSIINKIKKIILIEKDSDLVDKLNKLISKNPDGKLINTDILKYDLNSIQDSIRVIGNLPYNISTQILVKWIKIQKLEKFCKKLVLMFQKEVADRIIAKVNTKNYGRLSILSNWKMNIEKIIDIEPHNFSPVPKVKSTLLVFTPKKKFFELVDPKNLEHVTNIFFSQRRKMIKKPLKYLFNNFEEISKKLNLDLSLRPQNLDCLTYYKISDIYESLID